jgi:hypothetical protein
MRLLPKIARLKNERISNSKYVHTVVLLNLIVLLAAIFYNFFLLKIMTYVDHTGRTDTTWTKQFMTILNEFSFTVRYE